jgi:hypothetical protein
MSAAIHQDAEQLRGIPLPQLLNRHGLESKPEGASLRVRTDQLNLVVTGNRWFDNKAGIGGVGAIDLQMHLGGQDFSTACQTLAKEFGQFPPPPHGVNFPSGKSMESERLPFPELMAKYAVRDEENWPVARAYLVECRKVEPFLIDEIHAVGSIYANDHRPNPALVFLHRTDCGKVVGASLRDTRHESAFRPTLGNKLTAWFTAGNVREAHSVVAVESPIDALSYHTLFAGRNDRMAVVSCSGSTVPQELLWQSYERRQRFVIGLDNDAAEERGWQKAWDETVDWTGFQISSHCPQLKDWNADLLASVQAVRSANIQKTSSLKL